MFATFILRRLLVVRQTASSFIAAPPINPPTSAGPFDLTIRQSISGVNRLPNWAPSAEIEAASCGNLATNIRDPSTIAPATMAGACIFW